MRYINLHFNYLFTYLHQCFVGYMVAHIMHASNLTIEQSTVS